MSKKNSLGNVDVTALEGLASSFPPTQPSTLKSTKGKPEKDVTITLRIPPRIAKDLRIKAATADKTQREFILEGLKLMGIDVKDEDIADRRKS
ncbi:hypothetical protein [Pleurocapsa sp. PCC 7319]|uniref:hypothetical protein n=1 Tax=Pleurocapsa sp. PCC 7319 TaxID=118161 RepID=UPI00034605DE|nr:hypothetical protein [Pleurocapsa sp. PCC 7319]